MSFLAELAELRKTVPRLHNIVVACENSDYCTHADKNKNCYLLFAANFCEDCLYGGPMISCQDCADSSYSDGCELCYECVDVEKCYNCNYCQDSKNCTDCTLCYDCIGCTSCFGSVGLRQKRYCFFNEQLSKEEYQKRLSELDIKDPAQLAIQRARFEELKKEVPRRSAIIMNSENCFGDQIIDSKNCYNCFDAHRCEDCMHLEGCWKTKDSMDLMYSDGSELCYESFSLGLGSYNCNFCTYIRSSSDCEYSELLFSCKHCFGCIGLQNKEYYILNKPYSREEYFKKVTEIKEQMRVDGEYGRHLPSTYPLEDTAAKYLET